MTTDQQQTEQEWQDTAPDNTVNWWEIQVPDLAAAQAFYGAVFGWTFAPFGDSFAMIKAPNGEMIGGLDQVAGDPAGRHVQIYVKVTDLEASIAAVRAAGGGIRHERQLISEEYGWYAIIEDPWGLRIGLATSRPPAEG